MSRGLKARDSLLQLARSGKDKPKPLPIGILVPLSTL
jgi:hypothetical protein